jgi:hypothetical protein
MFHHLQLHDVENLAAQIVLVTMLGTHMTLSAVFARPARHHSNHREVQKEQVIPRGRPRLIDPLALVVSRFLGPSRNINYAFADPIFHSAFGPASWLAHAIELGSRKEGFENQIGTPVASC